MSDAEYETRALLTRGEHDGDDGDIVVHEYEIADVGVVVGVGVEVYD